MTWSDILEQVTTFRTRVFERKRAEPFFRGHAKHSWALQPSLFRYSRSMSDPRQVIVDEGRIYWRVVRLGSHLLPKIKSSWDTLFVMQHHGMPTRLLDWTESFGTALWFALNECSGSDPCVWMLDQYQLNELESGHDALYLPDYDFTPEKGYASGYEPYVVDIGSRTFADFPHRIVSIAGVSSIPRLHSQRGVFTLHRDPAFAADSDPALRSCFQKVTIPEVLVPQAREYLAVAGINSFTIFPDLFGLNLYVCRAVLGKDSGDLL